MQKHLENFTKIAFISLATLPLLKVNFNSMLIILCALLTIYFLVKTKKKIFFPLKYLLLILPFLMYFCYEIISGSFNVSRILIQLPFLIFPLLFIFKPDFINYKIKELSFFVFQCSVVFQSIIYLFIFLKSNSLVTLFNISPENIPFFRQYVMSNYFFEIHPTYFSAFLLVSITLSFFNFKKFMIFNFLNIIISIFFLFLFSSRVIILLLFFTIISFILYILINEKGKIKYVFVFGSLLILTFFLIFGSEIIKKRLNETITEINKPVEGNYHNSTNVRMAIYKCDYLLIKNIPFFGFGNNIQNELNRCYKENNNSNFYKISTYNSHNYYFNLILYGGWFFLVLFLFYLCTLFKHLRYSALGIFIFIQFLSINITENYLSRHYGIVLFCYFTSLFIFFKKEKFNAATKYI
ncbi:O-antigen ligase family protein [Polaribacter sp. PL03]|uniref:O-antigen ligase family protein n=1 Tax=Polaribacter sp. PL03 TaxID=3088353 RepID=UPI0039B6FABC